MKKKKLEPQTVTDLAIIGGSGFDSLKTLKITHREVFHTPYGEPSSPLVHGLLGGKKVVFLPRHGAGHRIPPHRVNYRANLWALKQIDVQQVIAVAAVGAIHPSMQPGGLVVPDQIIDYTYGRSHTMFEEELSHVTHIDFTHPYCGTLRELLIGAAESAGLQIVPRGTYGATQGPRLETAMEINRMERDGCDLVGMTGMPETALARELDLCYACCAVVANWAAGRGDGAITMDEIEKNLTSGMGAARSLLEQAAEML
jgi:5'-methylthioinosine phosphorylase